MKLISKKEMVYTTQHMSAVGKNINWDVYNKVYIVFIYIINDVREIILDDLDETQSL